MLYIGPASAFLPPGAKRGKPGNAVVMRMRKMTARALAYVAVQVRFFYTSSPGHLRGYSLGSICAILYRGMARQIGFFRV
jgi:hypothetical protein